MKGSVVAILADVRASYCNNDCCRIARDRRLSPSMGDECNSPRELAVVILPEAKRKKVIVQRSARESTSRGACFEVLGSKCWVRMLDFLRLRHIR